MVWSTDTMNRAIDTVANKRSRPRAGSPATCSRAASACTTCPVTAGNPTLLAGRQLVVPGDVNRAGKDASRPFRGQDCPRNGRPPRGRQAFEALQEPLPPPSATCQVPDMELPDTDPE